MYCTSALVARVRTARFSAPEMPRAAAAATSLAEDLRLFATTFAAGFLFLTIYLA